MADHLADATYGTLAKEDVPCPPPLSLKRPNSNEINTSNSVVIAQKKPNLNIGQSSTKPSTSSVIPVSNASNVLGNQNWEPVFDVTDEELAKIPDIINVTQVSTHQESLNFNPNRIVFAPNFSNCSNVTINFGK
jgi:hypothetical protein